MVPMTYNTHQLLADLLILIQAFEHFFRSIEKYLNWDVHMISLPSLSKEKSSIDLGYILPPCELSNTII